MDFKRRKAQYSKIGTYSGYKKNNKERAELDYYSTPIEEVTNILNILNIDFENSIILEPSCGGGHMMQGILNYLENKKITCGLYGTDVMERDFSNEKIKLSCSFGEKYDFLGDNYLENLTFPKEIDYIIMNPPYATLEPHIMRALGIAKKGVLVLCRLQVLEGQSRYNNIFSDITPSDCYVYVDRITCYKNGDTTQKMASVQAYCWLWFDFTKETNTTQLHWIRKAGK